MSDFEARRHQIRFRLGLRGGEEDGSLGPQDSLQIDVPGYNFCRCASGRRKLREAPQYFVSGALVNLKCLICIIADPVVHLHTQRVDKKIGI